MIESEPPRLSVSHKQREIHFADVFPSNSVLFATVSNCSAEEKDNGERH
jgi:hypothetical protein